MGGFFDGVRDFARGAAYLASHPRLYKWVVAPFALALVVFGVAAWGAWRLSGTAADAVTGLLPDVVATVLGPVLGVVALLFVGFLGYVAFVAVAALITAPFCEMLSEAVEEALTGSAGPEFSPLTFVRDILLGILHAIRRVVLYLLSVVLVLLIGAVIPVVGPLLGVAIGAWFTARFAAYDALDAIMARKGWSYAQKQQFLDRHRARTTGLGASMAGCFLAPIANLVALPIGAVGATLLFLDAESGVGRDVGVHRDHLARGQH